MRALTSSFSGGECRNPSFGLTTKVKGLQGYGPRGILREKSHLDVGSVASHKVYYNGEGGGFPPSSGRGESNVSVLPVTRPRTKGAPTMR